MIFQLCKQVPTMPTNIFLFTAPVNSGKTTALMEWAKSKDRLGGFLAPDIEGLRRLYRLRDRQLHLYQLSAAALAAAAPEAVVNIGKFNFAAEAFELARRTLLEDLAAGFDWVVIDEIGKLELRGEGLEPAVGQVIASFQRPEAKGNLLLVVRDELVDKVAQHYGIADYEAIELGQLLPG
jgi:nucleoside-triphosphatase